MLKANWIEGLSEHARNELIHRFHIEDKEEQTRLAAALCCDPENETKNWMRDDSMISRDKVLDTSSSTSRPLEGRRMTYIDSNGKTHDLYAVVGRSRFDRPLIVTILKYGKTVSNIEKYLLPEQPVMSQKELEAQNEALTERVSELEAQLVEVQEELAASIAVSVQQESQIMQYEIQEKRFQAVVVGFKTLKALME